MDAHTIISSATEYGASSAAAVRIADIRYYPQLLELCEMNSCGHYAKSWSCPPGCGTPADIEARLTRFSDGVVFQYIGRLEDSFDYENMTLSAQTFKQITQKLLSSLRVDGAEFMLMGVGHCSLCEDCTYPAAPCRRPDQLIVPVEACGINVSELCALAGLNYINGQNTVTYTGLAAFNQI